MAHIAVHEALWRVALGEPGPSDSFSCPSPNGVIVKAACGKSARAVWAAGGGQREGSTERASPDPTLCGGESPLHGEAASGSRSVLGRHEPHSTEENGPLCNEWNNRVFPASVHDESHSGLIMFLPHS